MGRIAKRIAQGIAKWTGIMLAGAVGVALLLLATLLLGANTDPGRKVLVWLVPHVTGGEVRVEGLSGSFPRAFRAQSLTLADASGPYLTGRDVAVDWQPLRMLHGAIIVDRLTSAEIRLLRLPKSNGNSSSKSLNIKVKSFSIGRLDLPASLTGTPASLTASGTLEQRPDGTEALSLDARRLDSGGLYRVTARLTPREVALSAHIEEPAQGLLARLAGLPNLGAIHLMASLSGPRTAIATNFAVTAGPLSAHAKGTIDLARKSADLTLDAAAPSMKPRPGVSWQSVSLHARVAGPFARPFLNGTLDLERLSAAGAEIGRIAAAIRGDEGEARLKAMVSGIVLPGPAKDLLAAAPLTLSADAHLGEAGRPVSFTLDHPLIAASGIARTEGEPSLNATITLPDLAPLASLGGVALKGQGHLRIAAEEGADGLALNLEGGLGLSGGMAPLLALLGPAPRFSLAVRLAGSDVHLSHLSLSGTALSLGAQGSLVAQKLALGWTASLRDLSVLAVGVSGMLDAKGQVDGPMDSLALDADLTGRLGAANFSPEPVRAHLAVHGLPDTPTAELTAAGTIVGAPLRLALSAARSAGTLTVAIHEAEWKSARAGGRLAIRGSNAPSGKINFSINSLEDFSQILHAPVRGSIAGSLSAAALPASSGPPRLTLDLTAENLAASGASVGNAVLAANILDPLGDRRLEARLTLTGIAAGGLTGASAQLSASGPMNAVALQVSASTPAFNGASVAATATLDSTRSEVNLSALTAHWHGTTLRLLAPARIAYAPGLSVANLGLGMAGAEFSANGRIQPDLALTVGAHNITPALLAPFAPGLQAKGRLDADATLSGSLAAPAGHLSIRGSGLGLASEFTAGLPPASLQATADLAGREARITAGLSAGASTHLTLFGTVPLAPAGALNLAARGAIDLGILDPILTAEGRRVEGTLALDAEVTGSTAKPVLTGTVRLSGGTLVDYANGVSIRDLSGEISAAGDTVRIARLEGRAGTGTIGLSGSIGVFAPDLPVNLVITARDAELPQSDLMTMRFDSDLAIRGEAEGNLAASGTVRIRRAEIRIPDRLPPSIPVLHVVRAGSKPPPPSAPGPDIALNLTISAAREIFVRGRGINTEFGGHIHIGGTAASPLPEGNFTLVRGQVSLAGKTLTFSSGTIGFNGNSPEDPTLDLVATTETASTTATLTIGGTAESPTVTLSSTPELPQDQILATLLFGTNSSSLSPFQIAEIANSLTTLTGVGPSTGDPLGALRSGLGLDQLSVGSSANGSPTLQAGRYLAPGVYVGANQSASGGGSQAEVQINLTKQLQLNATVGAGPANATGATSTSGTSVGITYQFQY